MKRLALTVVVLALVAMVATGGSPERAPAQGTRPYEGTTLRAVVNAEYVKYSLSLVEKDVYDKLGIKLDVEVIPARRLRAQDPAGVQQRLAAPGTSSCSAPATCPTTGGTSSRWSPGPRS